MNNLFLITATLLMGIIFLAGLYERFVNMPKWFSNPPASFALIREHTPKARKIHIPLQILFLISFVIALIQNWEAGTIRTYMLLSIASFIIIIIITVKYFAKEIIVFTKIPEDAPSDPELIKRAEFWEKWTTVRNVLQLIGFIFLVLALTSQHLINN